MFLPPPDVRTTARRGFTIIEILVVTAIITLLVGLAVPALRSVRQSGRKTVEISAARQVMMAWSNYSNHYRDRVLPGYYDDPDTVVVRDASRRRIGVDLLTDFRGPAARARYPWRLAPFLNYNFRGLYLNREQELLERYEQEDPEMYIYLVSLFPSLGYNTTWIGGDADKGAFDPGALETFGRYYVVSSSQVRNPSGLLVFASARGAEDPFDPSTWHEGYFRLESPYLREGDGPQWSEQFRPSDRPDEYGYLSPRWDGRATVAYADGHVGERTADQLRDMRLWANDADRPDWELRKR